MTLARGGGGVEGWGGVVWFVALELIICAIELAIMNERVVGHRA